VSSLFAVAAASWGVLMALSPLLQIRAMRRAGSSDGVSIGYLLVLAIGFGLWFMYGLSIGNLALIVTNTASLIVGTTTTITAWRLRPAARVEAAATTEPALVAVG
jgi:MtN3 and saliva related transmembrane protein